MSEMASVPNAIQYQSEKTVAPRYRYRKIPLYQASSASMSIPVGTSQLCQFKLAADVVNFAKSYVGYDLTIPAQTDLSGYIWNANDVPLSFSTIQLTDAGQFAVMSVPYAMKYARTGRKIETKVVDYLDLDNTSCLSNALSSANVTCTNIASTANYLEPSYCETAAAPATAVATSRLLPLNAFHNSIFALDRDQYFGRDMFINIMAGNAMNFAWTARSNTNPTTNAAAVSTGSITLANFYLYLAVEVNPAIVSAVQEKYLQGRMTYRIPYPYTVRLSTDANVTSASLIQTMQPTQGISIRKIIYECYNGTETSNTCMDDSNVNGSKIVSYQTTMDSQPLQDQYLSCLGASSTSLDDYRENKKFCKNTCLFDAQIYQKNWFHIDSWEPEERPGIDKINLEGGLKLDQPRTWGININFAAAVPSLAHYITFILERELTVSPLGGFQFDISKGSPSAVPSPSVM